MLAQIATFSLSDSNNSHNSFSKQVNVPETIVNVHSSHLYILTFNSSSASVRNSSGATVCRFTHNGVSGSYKWGSYTAHIVFHAIKPPYWEQHPLKAINNPGYISIDLNQFVVNPSGEEYTILCHQLAPGFTLLDGTLYGNFDYGNFSMSFEVSNEIGGDTTTLELSVIPTGIDSDEAHNEKTNVKNITIDLYTGQNATKNIASYFNDRSSTFSASGLPSYLSLSKYGLLTGYVSYSEHERTYNCNLNVIGGLTINVDFKINIHSLSSSQHYFTSSSSASGMQGQSFNYKISTNRQDSYIANGLPSFLTLVGDTITGIIPANYKSFSFSISATNIELGTINKMVAVKVSSSKNGDSGDTPPTGGGGGGADDEVSADNHVIVDNFDDISNTRFANDNKKGLEKIASGLSDIKDEVSGSNKMQGRINDNLVKSNSKFDKILDTLDEISDKSGSDSNSSSGNVNGNGDLIDYFNDVSGIGDMSTTDFEKEIHQKDISISTYDNILGKSYGKSLPKFTIPFSGLYRDIPDLEIDFQSNDFLMDLFGKIRSMLAGIIVIFGLYHAWKITRTFEW